MLAEIGFSLRPTQDSVPFQAYPPFGAPRWLLPASRSAAKGSWSLYQPSTLLGKLRKPLLKTGIVLGGAVWIDRHKIEALTGQLARLFGRANVEVAFSIRVPKVSHKAIVQIMDSGGDVLAYAKMGYTESSKRTLSEEWDMLHRLNAQPSLLGMVPLAIGRLDWDLWSLIVVSAGPASPAGTTLSSAHLHFLSALHNSTLAIHQFETSPMWKRILAKMLGPQDGLPWEWRVRYHQAKTLLEQRLTGLPVPTSAAHRDFSPWNIRMNCHSLFVFDWEMASWNSSPCYDALHFCAIQRAVKNQNLDLPWKRILEFLGSLWPDGTTLFREVLLLYFLDMSLDYAEALQLEPTKRATGVWEWFGAQIDRLLCTDSVD